MMLFIIAITAQLVWSGPKLTPAEGAKILAASPGITNRTGKFVCIDCDGPKVFIINSTPGALGWLTFPAPNPPRRLDGSLLDSRPPESAWQPMPTYVFPVTPGWPWPWEGKR